jgi:uncharacterized protein (UPF0276 family)
MVKTLDIQDICDQCCDAGLDVNNIYIGEVFQWLENNDYQIIKKIPEKRIKHYFNEIKSS